MMAIHLRGKTNGTEGTPKEGPMRSASCWILILLLCLVAHVSAPPAHAQLPTGEISGTVTDPSGAAVPGAKIDIVNQATSETRTTNATSSGAYSFLTVIPGLYTLISRSQRCPAARRSNLST
jgi:Carboxypeptidase regulatory-like domain